MMYDVVNIVNDVVCVCVVCVCVFVCGLENVPNDNLPIRPNKHQSAMSRPELA